MVWFWPCASVNPAGTGRGAYDKRRTKPSIRVRKESGIVAVYCGDVYSNDDCINNYMKGREMKRIIEETENQGLESLLGERVLIMCAGYFYEGKLMGVNEKCVEISDSHIVYETGAFDKKDYGDRQKLHTDKWFVSIGLIESFGESKCK